MKKASLLFILLICGLMLAQGGVRISEPLDGTFTSISDKEVVYMFDHPASIDPATVVLNINGVDYTVADAEITWSSTNLIFTPSTDWVDGEVVNLALTSAATYEGEIVEDLPLESSFTVDLSAPYMVDYNPGTLGAAPALVNNTFEPVLVWLDDAVGTINENTIVVEIEGIEYDVFDAGVSWDAEAEYVDGAGLTHTFGLFTFDPAVAGVEWTNFGSVEIHVSSVEDVIDYGSTNVMSFYDESNNFSFNVDAIGPEVTALTPVNGVEHVDGYVYVSCSDQIVRIRFDDPNGIDLTSLVVDIRGEELTLDDAHLTVEESSAVHAIVVYTPNPQFYDGEIIEIEVLALNDMLGNPFETYIGPEPWMILTDLVGPSVSNPLPIDGTITADVNMPISFDIFDEVGMVDAENIEVHIVTSSGGEIVLDDFDEFWIPWCTWDGTTYTFDPYVFDSLAVGGFNWTIGDIVTVTVLNVTDMIDFCEPNDMTNPALTWQFTVAEGPQAALIAPLDHEFTSCERQQVTFTFVDPTDLDESTVVFEFEGDAYTIDTEVITEIIPRYVPAGDPTGVLVRIDTFTSFPLTVADGIFTFDPPAFYEMIDGLEIECQILAAEDLAGNPLWDAPVFWSFVIDLSAPYIVGHYPADGAYEDMDYTMIEVEFADDVCGSIDPANTAVTINGFHFGPDMYGSDTWDVVDNVLTIFPEDAGVTFEHMDEVEVCITHLADNPENRCAFYGNKFEGLPYCWTFTVDGEAPIVELIEPADEAVTACAEQQIVFNVTDDIGVVAGGVFMEVNGVLYFGGEVIEWIDENTLVFTPATPFEDGEVVNWTLEAVMDLAGNMAMYDGSDDASTMRGSFTVDLSDPIVTATSPADGEEVVTTIDDIAVTVEDAAGINWETATMVVTVGEVVYEYNWADGFFTVAGNTIALDVVAADIPVAIAGEVFDVVFTVEDNVDYACDAANMTEYAFSFGVTPGWYMNITVDGVTLDDNYDITLGAAVGATDGLDIGVDVFDVVAAPAPPHYVHTTFQLEDGTRLTKDVKDIENLMPRWKIWSGSDAVTLTWNPEDLPPFGSFTINGVLDMRDPAHAEYHAEAGEVVWINYSVNYFTLYEGWNLVSSPVHPTDPSPEAVFPDAITVWEYNSVSGSYIVPEEIIVGRAYFVLYPFEASFTIAGIPAYDYTLGNLRNGWNLIGSVYDFGGTDFTAPVTIPADVITPPVYGYDNATGMYVPFTELYAGGGYYTFVELPAGFTNASLEVNAFAKTRVTPVETAAWSCDMNVAGMNLTIGQTEGSVRTMNLLLPPAAPNGNLPGAYLVGDVNKTAEYKATGDAEWTLRVNASSELVYSTGSLDNIELTIDGEVIDGNGSIELNAGVYKINANVVTDKPAAYALHANTPNPFNGATTISFDVAKDTRATLTVVDMMGRTVSTLLDREVAAGSHSVVWNGTDDNGNDMPTGVYFYNINAGSFKAIDKMLYVK